MKGTVLYCLDQFVTGLGQRDSSGRPRTATSHLMVAAADGEWQEEWRRCKASAGVEPFFTPNANYAPDQLPKLIGAAIYHTGMPPGELGNGAVEFFFDSRLWRLRSSSVKGTLADSLRWVFEAAWGLPLAVLAREEEHTVRVSIHGDGLEIFADFAEAAARRLARDLEADIVVFRLPKPGAIEEMRLSFQLPPEPAVANASRTQS